MHTEDRQLVEAGILKLGDLITIRHGEYILHPISDAPLPAKEELLKIQGKGGSWCCKFLDNDSLTCTIYNNRPLACRLLKCWDPDDVLKITGKELLNRFDLIPPSNPLFSLTKKHDSECPVPDITSLVDQLFDKKQREETLARMSGLANRDLQARLYAAQMYHLSLADELFYFGRPIFRILEQVGISAKESVEGLSLHYNCI